MGVIFEQEYRDVLNDYITLLDTPYTIIEKWYDEIMEKLNEEEKKFIATTDILAWFKENANRYDNIRLLKTRLENAIYNELTEEYVFKTE